MRRWDTREATALVCGLSVDLYGLHLAEFSRVFVLQCEYSAVQCYKLAWDSPTVVATCYNRPKLHIQYIINNLKLEKTLLNQNVFLLRIV